MVLPGPASHCYLFEELGVRLVYFVHLAGKGINGPRPEQLGKVSTLLSLFWFWLRSQNSHPNVWRRCYWLVADVLLPSHDPHRASRALVRLGEACVTHASDKLLAEWREKRVEFLLLRGLRVNKEIIGVATINKSYVAFGWAAPTSPKTIAHTQESSGHGVAGS